MNLNLSAEQCWVEWKERCALGRCDEPTQQTLRAFVTRRFGGLLERFQHWTNAAAAPVPRLMPSDPWHLFETHLTVNQTSAGKRYKDWLFAWAARHRVGGLDAIQNGVALLLRDVVREHLRREFSPSDMVSLQQPSGDGDHGVTLEDLLPGEFDPAAEAERHEFERQAQAQARQEWSGLTQRERVALLAKDLGVSLAHPVVQQLAGCSKSLVNQAYRDLILRIAARLRTDYDEDDPAAVIVLTRLTLEALRQLGRDWGRSERACRELFIIAGDAPPLETQVDR